MRQLFKRSSGEITTTEPKPYTWTERVPARDRFTIQCSSPMTLWDTRGNRFEIAAGDTFVYDNDTNKAETLQYHINYQKVCPDRPPVEIPKPKHPARLDGLEEGQVGWCTSNALKNIDGKMYVSKSCNNVRVGVESCTPPTHYVKMTRTCDGFIADYTQYKDKDEASKVLQYNTEGGRYLSNYTPVVKVIGLPFDW